MAEHRYEREIDELLRRMESEHGAPLPFRRRTSSWASRWRRLRDVLIVQSAVERLMAVAALSLLATLILGVFAPRFAAPLAGVALGCFVLALGLSVWHGASGHGPNYGAPSRHYGPQRAVNWDQLVWRLRRWLRRLRG